MILVNFVGIFYAYTPLQHTIRRTIRLVYEPISACNSYMMGTFCACCRAKIVYYNVRKRQLSRVSEFNFEGRASPLRGHDRNLPLVKREEDLRVE